MRLTFKTCDFKCGAQTLNVLFHLLPAAAAAPMVAATAAAAAAAVTSPGLNVAALLASGTQVTPQIAMAAQMAALQAKTLAETGIAVPSYYNPSSVNPARFAEQEKKRKMLWQGKKDGVRLDFAALFIARWISLTKYIYIFIYFWTKLGYNRLCSFLFTFVFVVRILLFTFVSQFFIRHFI